MSVFFDEHCSWKENSHSNQPQHWQFTGSVYFASQEYV